MIYLPIFSFTLKAVYIVKHNCFYRDRKRTNQILCPPCEFNYFLNTPKALSRTIEFVVYEFNSLLYHQLLAKVYIELVPRGKSNDRGAVKFHYNQIMLFREKCASRVWTNPGQMKKIQWIFLP